MELSTFKDWYFGICTQKEKTEGRGKADNTASVPCLWCEIDIKNPKAHASQNLPSTPEEADSILKGFPAPSIIVSSGHGFHVYWKFIEPFHVNTPEDLEYIKNLERDLQSAIRKQAQKSGWDIDPTHDLARVFRVPGTYNNKERDNPRLVKFKEQKDKEYIPADFEKYRQVRKTKPKKEDITVKEKGNAWRILKLCPYMQYCKEHSQTLTEPEWHGMISTLASADDGVQLIHQLSMDYPDYSAEETDKKIQRAIAEDKPHTCETINETLGFAGCLDCPYYAEVTAPICLGTRADLEASHDVSEIRQKEVITDSDKKKIIKKMALLQKSNENEYIIQKSALKGILTPTELTKAVKNENNKRDAAIIAKATDKKLQKIPDFPLADAVLPPLWHYDDGGVWGMKTDGQHDIMIKDVNKCACPVPIGIIKRLQDIDTHNEKLELAWYRDTEWHSTTADRANIFSRQGIVLLGNHGIPVSSESAKYLIQFLEQMERENLLRIPLEIYSSHVGWLDKDNFIPYTDKVKVNTDDIRELAGFTQEGDFSTWRDSLKPLYDIPQSRFALACSYAAPLLKILNKRIMICHLWGKSGKGKTATLKAALSVWGEPDMIMGTFNTTITALELLASAYCDVPFGIDEKQIKSGKYNMSFIESLVYMISEGKGKTRGSKNGGLRKTHRWRNVIISTGEHSLAEDSTSGGIRTRAIELYWKPFADENLAGEIYDIVPFNYGMAGEIYTAQLIKYGSSQIQALYDRFKDELPESNKIKSHLDMVTVCAVADQLSRQWIYDVDEETAHAEAYKMATEIISMLSQSEVVDDGERAWQLVENWISSNEEKFTPGCQPPQYGFVEKDIELQTGKHDLYYIYPQYLEKVLQEYGFSPRRAMQDFAEAGHIQVFDIKGEKRYRKQKSHNGRRVTVICAPMKQEEIM